MKNVKAAGPKTRQIMLVAFLLATTPIFAMVELGIAEAAQELLDELKSVAPILFGVVFIVAVILNIGKVTGESRDYKSFLTSVGLWILSLFLIGAVFEFIVSFSF